MIKRLLYLLTFLYVVFLFGITCQANEQDPPASGNRPGSLIIPVSAEEETEEGGAWTETSQYHNEENEQTALEPSAGERVQIEYVGYQKPYYDNSDLLLVQIAYKLPHITGGGKNAEEFNMRMDEKKQNILKNEQALVEDAINLYNTQSDKSYFYAYYNTLYAEPVYQDDRYYTIAITEYLYSGGFHGFTTTEYITLDLETGQELKLKDITRLGEKKFEKLLRNKMMEQSQDSGVLNHVDTVGQNHSLNSYSFYPAANGLHVQFGEYELTSYSGGMPDFVIPYVELNLKIPLHPEQTDISYDEGYYYYGAEDTDWSLLEADVMEQDSGTRITVTSKPAEFIPWEQVKHLINDHPIQFNDPNAELKVRMQIKHGTGTVWYSELWNLTELDLTPYEGMQITNIDYLWGLQNMKVINLNYNALTSISTLAGMINLEGVFFNGNQVTDLTPLMNLKHLERLDMSNNPIADFSLLREMKSLKKIHSFGNGLNDGNFSSYIDCVADLPQLELLDVGNNSITDFSPLARMQQISSLSLWNSDIDDAALVRLVDAVSSLPHLKKLSLSHNQISDISPLLRLSALEEVIVDDNPVTDCSVLEERGITVSNN